MKLTNWAILAATASALAYGGMAQAADAALSSAGNPFAAPSALPYQAPPFDRIKDTDYQPAFEQGMAEQDADIAKITHDPAAPTFDNTIVALERSGRMLDRVNLAFGGVSAANTNSTLDAVDQAETPRLSAHEDSIYLSKPLFARVRALHDQRAHLKLDPEQAQLLEVYYQQFVHAGALLSDADQAKLRAINEKIASLETDFHQKLLAATKAGALVVHDRAVLAGLDAATIDNAAEAAKARGLPGSWLIALQNTTPQPALEDMTDRATRQALFESSWTRAEKGDANDTRGTIATLAQLRAQKAALFGYPNYAAYVLYDQMAKTPEAVEHFIARLTPAVAAEQKREAAMLQAAIAQDHQSFTLKPWDWAHYAQIVRRAKYALDPDQVKPYFELHRVLEDGVFYAANQLYGLTFKRRTDIPVYQPDVMTYEVFDHDGSPLGLMYFDYFKRDNKSGGAWMSNFVNQSKLIGTRPVIYNVANFAKPAPGQPALISFDDATTMFHEFGHALHGLFADQTYPTLSGTAVARDFVEFPSQFNEHWALDPKVFAHYARHYQTGAPMPQMLVDKIKRAAKFDQGFVFGEIIEAAKLDMDWHALPASAPKQDVDAFEAASLGRMGLDTADVPPRYRSSYFLHIWSNGYSAGYYAYLWTEMLDDDVFSWFRSHGGLTRSNGQRFRDMILSRGHTMDYGPMFKAFYGQAPDIGPLLVNHGLNVTPN